ELGEIEQVLTGHPLVREAVVTAPGDRHHRRLTAHIVPATHDPTRRPTASAAVDPELFGPEERERVLFDETDRVEFKIARRGLRRDLTGDPVELPATGAGPATRTSRRRYAHRPVALRELSGLLATLRSHETGALPRYRYGSAGNSYAVQTYLHVVDGRVDELPGGTYYHDPARHRLVPVRPGAVLTSAVRLGADRQALDTAAFEIFLVADLDAVEPLYGPRTARDVCLIEAGLIAQCLEDATTGHGIGLCQLRVVDGMRELRSVLRLGDRHEVLHALLGGALLRAGEEPAEAPEPLPAFHDDPQALLDVVRAHLAAHLPEYLLPSSYTVLDALPRTPAGAVDHAALADPAALADSTAPAGPVAPGPGAAPAGAEDTIAEVLRTLLGASTVGRDTGFFQLGADSLLLVRAHRQLQEALGRRFPLTHMFEHATIRRLASALDTASDDGADLLAEAARRANRARRRGRPVSTPTGADPQEGQA
ncbi:SagB/ThcOx family dehydrogenase, partial [Salinispora arenicola]